MANDIFQEWLDRNSHRRFPLADDCDLSCLVTAGDNGLDEKRTLPLNLLLDARFCLFGLEDGPVLLKSATIGSDGAASIVVGVPGRGDVLIDGSGVWSDGSEFSARVVFGPPGDLMEFAGEYALRRPAEFSRSRVISIPYGIGVDTLACGDVEVSGDIRVVDGRNSSLDISRNNLVLTLRKGLGLGVECQNPILGSLCNGKMLYYINGQKADSNGNLDIIGGEGITVSTGTFKGIPAVIVCTSPLVNNFAYSNER